MKFHMCVFSHPKLQGFLLEGHEFFMYLDGLWMFCALSLLCGPTLYSDTLSPILILLQKVWPHSKTFKFLPANYHGISSVSPFMY